MVNDGNDDSITQGGVAIVIASWDPIGFWCPHEASGLANGECTSVVSPIPAGTIITRNDEVLAAAAAFRGAQAACDPIKTQLKSLAMGTCSFVSRGDAKTVFNGFP